MNGIRSYLVLFWNERFLRDTGLLVGYVFTSRLRVETSLLEFDEGHLQNLVIKQD